MIPGHREELWRFFGDQIHHRRNLLIDKEPQQQELGTVAIGSSGEGVDGIRDIESHEQYSLYIHPLGGGDDSGRV